MVPIEKRQAFIQAVIDAAAAQEMTPRDVVFECVSVAAGLYIQCGGTLEEMQRAAGAAWTVQGAALAQLHLDFGGAGFWDAPAESRRGKAVAS